MDFVPTDFTEFRYVACDWDSATSTASFGFSLVGPTTESFTETVQFAAGEPDERFHAVLVLLGAILGLSYYKAAAPPRYVVEVDGLTDAGLDYLALTLREGLAEFAYRAGLDGFLEPEITRTGTPGSRPAESSAVGAPLVPIGGGKDSIVSVESLAAVGLAPLQFAVNPNVIINRVAAVSGHAFVSAKRTIDRHLLDLNGRGALNGHVPVTTMNSLIAVGQALLLGAGPVVMSNESSASDPTLQWHGQPVNHQWSKSLDAERALDTVLRAQVGIADAYFSLLRPFSEVRIAKGFTTTTKYDSSFVSCNRAFRLGAGDVGWCGDCDKCRFVFLAFTPYLSSERLTAIFGKNMFEDATQLQGYRALLGLDAHKPFECVGEEAECTVAMSLASRTADFGSSAIVTALLEEIPNLRDGDAALEATVMANSPALAVAPEYERARYALA